MLSRCAFLLCVGLFVFGCSDPTRARDAAWHNLQEALVSNNSTNAIVACEAYLSHVGPSNQDTFRTGQVHIAYRRAFLRWLSTVPANPDIKARKHIEFFQTYMRDTGSLKERP